VDCRAVWAAVTDIVLQREDLSQQERAWFRLTSLRAVVDDTAVLEVPDAYAAWQVETTLRTAIVDALGRHLGRSVNIVLTLPATLAERKRETRPATLAERKQETPADGAPIEPTLAPDNPLGPVGESSGLNPEHTFQTFAIGLGNRYAQALAYAVADAPAMAYNPLIIVGGSAAERTHLLHAIGNAALAIGTARSVLCVPADEFTSHVTDRALDILLVDGFPLRENPQRTEELLHTIATLYRAGTPVALTVDCEPEDLAALEDLVRARFTWGVVAVINH